MGYQRSVHGSNEDVDNSKDDGWRKVETKFADEERISSLTLESVFGQTEKPKRGDEYDGQNKNEAPEDGEAKDGTESKNSNRICSLYNRSGGPSRTTSVTGKSAEGPKNENEKETDDNSKE